MDRNGAMIGERRPVPVESLHFKSRCRQNIINAQRRNTPQVRKSETGAALPKGILEAPADHVVGVGLRHVVEITDDNNRIRTLSNLCRNFFGLHRPPLGGTLEPGSHAANVEPGFAFFQVAFGSHLFGNG